MAATQALPALPFREAIEWGRARKVVLPDVYYGEMQGLARSMSFSIAGLAKLTQLRQVLDSLNDKLESGDTFREWKKRVESDEIGLDLPAHRIENIFRTNIQGQYSRGRCEQQARNLERRPWFLLDAVNDSRTRPSHAAMDGRIARYDDPFWSSYTPPIGYQCRCTRRAVTDKQAPRFQAADAKRMQDGEFAEARRKAKPDKGWDYNPCAEPTEGVRRAVEKAQPQAAVLGVVLPEPTVVSARVEGHRENVLRFGAAEGRERLVLMDERTGESLHQLDGVENAVRFDGTALELLRDDKRAIRLIHNHPGDSSLSTADFTATLNPGADHIEALGAHGSIYSGRAVVLDAGELSGSLGRGNTAVEKVFWAALRRGDMSQLAAQSLHHHAINTAAANAGVVDYHATLGAYKLGLLDDPAILSAFERAVSSAEKAMK